MRSIMFSVQPTGGAAAVQMKDIGDKVRVISVKARAANTAGGCIVVGKSDVTLTNGHALIPGDVHKINFGTGSDPLSSFYLCGTDANDYLDVTAVLG